LAHWVEFGTVPSEDVGYQDVVNSIVGIADRIEQNATTLSRLFPANELQPQFNGISGIAEGIRQLVTEIVTESHLEPIRWPQSRLSEDCSLLDGALQVMVHDLVEHIANAMPLSGLPADAITPELIRHNYQAAIQYAFTVFEDRLRARIGVGPEVFGEGLINRLVV